ncbi:CDP-alcohol phosphatidyltransferase family protein [Egicoccus halophilus]|uniref:CDP-diacylglycerol--glycerol-3-phosphate 3-phosphatidyltransferase n=1 Tax=Egicoccus halophilus TaxID=1670830 RepID=A0A8J3A6Y8_9ACTN|nr:CDP-alcohol phosphatidyltransferase family protein [Egicoccus halophilus]GGI04885.1 CDP-diacylglycerol--glycerol-3-phosphate 3-phosphatidyltransferase [Egicoccus halophilus]
MRIYDLGGGGRQRAASRRIWTIPNLLSFARLAILPVVYLDLTDGRFLRAFVLLAVFAATDWLDGYLARQLDQVTELGKLLDPISDRILFVVVGIGFVVGGLLPWWVVAVLIARDLLVGLAGLALLARGGRPPDVTRLGKTATFGLMWALPMLLLAVVVGDGVAAPQPLLYWLAWALLVVNIVLYWLAAFDYARIVRRRANATGGEDQNSDTPLR